LCTSLRSRRYGIALPSVPSGDGTLGFNVTLWATNAAAAATVLVFGSTPLLTACVRVAHGAVQSDIRARVDKVE